MYSELAMGSSIKPFLSQATESKAEVVIVSMSIVTAWHDLDDATEELEKTTHLLGVHCMAAF